jgi:hypothetical protein
LSLQVIAEYLQKIDPKSDGAKRDWVAIYDECASVLYQVMILSKVAPLLYLRSTEENHMSKFLLYWYNLSWSIKFRRNATHIEFD